MSTELVANNRLIVQCNWLFNAKTDILCFAMPLVVAPVLFKLSEGAFLISAASLFVVSEIIPAVGVFHIAASWSHYLDTENRRHYTENWKRLLTFVLIPLVLIALTGLGFVFDFRAAIGIIYLIWTVQHLSQQNVGILLLYHNPGEAFVPRSTLSKSLLIPAVLMGVLFFFRMSPMDISHLTLVVGAIVICFVNSGYHASLIFRQAVNGAPINLPAFLFWLMSSWFFLPIGVLASPHFECFTLPLFVHWCQYIGLNAVLFSRKYAKQQSAGALAAPHIKKVLLFVGLFVSCFIYLDHRSIPINDPSVKQGLAGLLLGFSFAHYFVDAFMWRFREPFQRQAILSYLKRAH